VAPAAFAVLPSRTLAGALVGRVLPIIFYSGIVIGLFVAALEWTAPAAGWRCATALALALSSAIAQFVVAPRIAAIRASVSGAIDALDASDPARQAFGRLHGLSVALMGLGALAACWCLLLLFRRLTRMEP
jgi:hypothetical protein